MSAVTAYYRSINTAQRRLGMVKEIYWMSHVGEKDDFGDRINGTIIDGKTKQGPWALMTPRSWRTNGCGKLGVGYGQKYTKQEDGRWLKVGG